MMPERPTHLDLCSGIGQRGFALAAGWAGYTTIGFCEIDPYCQRVLRKHWPEVPIHADLKTLTADAVRGWRDSAVAYPRGGDGEWGAEPGDGRADGPSVRGHQGPSLITAGYPCQPFSQAGKRLGEEDDRHLWPAIAALVAELRPAQCLFENVAGHITLGLDRVLADLEAIGYACRAVVVPAVAVNAPHRRDRVWIMADARDAVGVDPNANGVGFGYQLKGLSETRIACSAHQPRTDVADAADGGIRRGGASGHPGLPAFGGEVVADANRRRCGQRDPSEWVVPIAHKVSPPTNADGAGRREQRWPIAGGEELAASQLSDWWLAEPNVGRVAHGVPARAHRLRALGNAIVPAVAYEIICAMRAA